MHQRAGEASQGGTRRFFTPETRDSLEFRRRDKQQGRNPLLLLAHPYRTERLGGPN